MMNYVWFALICISFLCAITGSNMAEFSAAVTQSAANAVNLLLKLTGMLCLWGGIMEIAQQSQLTVYISRMMSPLLKPIFPRLNKNSPAMEYISMNVTANILGLGNAATPLGLEAMRRLQDENPSPATASAEMVVFVVMNTAAMRIIPTTVAMLRQQAGSQNPMEILPASVLTSFVALMTAILAAKLGNAFYAGNNLRLRTKKRKGLVVND